MEIPILKLVDHAVIPTQARPSDAGLDLVATSKVVNKTSEYIEYGTGLMIAIPDGYVGYIFPRSSISNTAMMMANSVGVIDAGYRGEIMVRFRCFDKREYQVGDRIAQIIIMPIPTVVFVPVGSLEPTERAEGAFGSTGI